MKGRDIFLDRNIIYYNFLIKVLIKFKVKVSRNEIFLLLWYKYIGEIYFIEEKFIERI